MEDLEFNFFELWKILRKHFLLIMMIALLFGSGVFLWNRYFYVPKYKASTTLYAWNAQGENAERVEYKDLMLSDRLIDDYKFLITSRRVTHDVNAALKKDQLLKTIKPYHLDVSVERNTRFLNLHVISTDPDTAYIVANVTAKVFVDTIKEMMKLKNVQVLDQAQKPIKPVDAKLPRKIGIGVFLGLLIGFGIGWLLEFFDRTIKTPEDIALNFKKPVMGTIPENEPNKGKDTDCAVDRSIGIVLFEKSRSHIAEAFRLLRTNIQYASPDNPPKIIMVSSAMPGEGKTSVVSNLALSLANSGKKVLVIDCDLRKPALHKMFKLGNIEGVVNFLVGDKKLDDCIHKEIMERLDIMTCGPLPPNPSELLMSEVFANMLHELRERYDYVFIDAPPSLNMADAAIIGRASDGLLFVVNSGRTRIDFVKKSLEQLEQVNVNVLGLLLNRFSLKTAGYNYYNYYNYYYYYYHYGPEPTTRRGSGK